MPSVPSLPTRAEPPAVPPGARDVSIPLDAVLRLALLPALLLLALPLLLFALRWGGGPLWDSAAGLGGLARTLGGFTLLIVAHELVHTAGWVVCGRLPLRAIRFGLDAKTLSPYARALVPMRARAYRIGAALPLLLTGVLPWLVALARGDGLLALLGALLISGAVGDLLVLWAIRAVPADARVLDHPTSAGCYVLPD